MVDFKKIMRRGTPAEKERFEERAAIIEYDGGLSREEAEDRAWAEIVNEREKNLKKNGG